MNSTNDILSNLPCYCDNVVPLHPFAVEPGRFILPGNARTIEGDRYYSIYIKDWTQSTRDWTVKALIDSCDIACYSRAIKDDPELYGKVCAALGAKEAVGENSKRVAFKALVDTMGETQQSLKHMGESLQLLSQEVRELKRDTCAPKKKQPPTSRRFEIGDYVVWNSALGHSIRRVTKIMTPSWDRLTYIFLDGNDSDSYLPSHLTLATRDQISAHLLEVAAKEGFTVGARVRDTYKGHPSDETLSGLHVIFEEITAGHSDWRVWSSLRVNRKKDYPFVAASFEAGGVAPISDMTVVKSSQKAAFKVGDYIRNISTHTTHVVSKTHENTIMSTTGVWMHGGDVVSATKEEISTYLLSLASAQGYVVGTMVDSDVGCYAITELKVIHNDSDAHAVEWASCNVTNNRQYPFVAVKHGDFANPLCKVRLVKDITYTLSSIPAPIRVTVEGKDYTAKFNKGYVSFGCARISNGQLRNAHSLFGGNDRAIDAGSTRHAEAVQIGKGLFTRAMLDQLVKRLIN